MLRPGCGRFGVAEVNLMLATCPALATLVAWPRHALSPADADAIRRLWRWRWPCSCRPRPTRPGRKSWPRRGIGRRSSSATGARRWRGRCCPRRGASPRLAPASALRPPGHGQFHVRLSRVPRAGSSVMLTIGERPFMLVARDDWAWSRGPLQEAAIIDAARAATVDAHRGPRRRRAAVRRPLPARRRTDRDRRRRRRLRWQILGTALDRPPAMTVATALMPIPGAIDPVPVAARRPSAAPMAGSSSSGCRRTRSARRWRQQGWRRSRPSCAPSSCGTGSTIAASAISPP